jgi:leucyl-tRNA synthetase
MGLRAVNPVTKEELPVFVADYVLAGYGTGAIMAVPAHDERDWEFAQKYSLPIKQVVSAGSDVSEQLMTEEGMAVNSDFLNGLKTEEAKAKIIEYLEANKLGAKKTNWKLKDWVFSRQRYWGEPMPLVFCEHCKNAAGFANKGEELNPGWFVDENLPVTLPEVESYQPSGTGESPLANISEWVNIKCPKCGGEARRETNTMPQWAGSSWYYLSYIMKGISNFQFPISNYKEIINKWSPVDMYVGGAEHATRHLIYARFWHKFLFDLGVVACDEPFTALRQVGLILAEDGRKMSKRWGNVINPDQIIESHGADAMRVYEMFMGPFNQSVAWSTNGLTGARKFLDKVWNLSEKLSEESDSRDLERLLHKTIKKVSVDIENLAFNTAVSAMMILVNAWTVEKGVNRDNFKKFVLLLAPFAPHLAEELWQVLGETGSVFKQAWPEYNQELARDERVKLVVQINSKLRETLELAADMDEMAVKEAAMASEKVAKWLGGQEIVKVVFVKNRLINFVVK